MALMNERNVTYKIAELQAHCAGAPDIETINKLITNLHSAIFPWNEISQRDNKQNLIDMLKEYY